MNCTICNQRIILVPSATERAVTTGKPASYYTSLFTAHTECTLVKRAQDTAELMRRKATP